MSLMTVVGTVFAVLVAFVVAVGYAVRRRARSDG
jgi:hypothetical protein